jgi:NodT family efflux transporter outer membrane factor (OMF) lipoprotein
MRAMDSYASAKTIAQFKAPPTPWPGQDWWTVYNDPKLTALIEQALKTSPDLRVVQARLQQAEAQTERARSAFRPTLSAKGAVDATGVEINLPDTPAQIKDFLPTSVQGVTQLSGNLNYQLDFFGRNRAALAAASSVSEAAEFEVAAARLQLSTAVAVAYAQLIQAQADLAAADEATKLREDSRDLVNNLLKNGLENRGEFSQSDAALSSSYVDHEQALGALLEARHALAALIGEGPDSTVDLEPTPGLTLTPIGLPPGVGADLIGRRPDISAARLRAEAAARREKVARTAFYPNISLTGSVLAASLTPQDILTHNVTLAQFGPALSLPIFDGGRLAGDLRGARGDYEEAVANYDKTLTQALREVMDAITVREGALYSLDKAQLALNADDQAYRLMMLRYKGGLASYLSVLTVQNALVANRRQVADFQAQSLIADVMMIRALGGGFQDSALASQQPSKDLPHG